MATPRDVEPLDIVEHVGARLITTCIALSSGGVSCYARERRSGGNRSGFVAGFVAPRPEQKWALGSHGRAGARPRWARLLAMLDALPAGLAGASCALRARSVARSCRHQIVGNPRSCGNSCPTAMRRTGSSRRPYSRPYSDLPSPGMRSAHCVSSVIRRACRPRLSCGAASSGRSAIRATSSCSLRRKPRGRAGWHGRCAPDATDRHGWTVDLQRRLQPGR
jgi:hypothetical protein